MIVIHSLIYVKRQKSTTSTVIHLPMPNWYCYLTSSKTKKKLSRNLLDDGGGGKEDKKVIIEITICLFKGLVSNSSLK